MCATEPMRDYTAGKDACGELNERFLIVVFVIALLDFYERGRFAWIARIGLPGVTRLPLSPLSDYDMIFSSNTF